MTTVVPRRTAAPADAPGPRPSSFDAVFDRPGSVRALAILRIALGPVVIAHLGPFLADSLRGTTYDERFHTPWFGFVPEVPGGVQVAMIWTGAAAAVALCVGWRTRLVAPLTFACVAGNFFLSQTHFRHNRAFLLFLLAAVALGESGRVLSLDARRRRRRRETGASPAHREDDRTTIWPIWLLRALASSVYLASGVSKLVDPDWVGGLVLWDRAVRYQDFVHDRLPGPIADVVVDVVTARWFHTVTSPIAVAMELFIGIGLWIGRTRLAAIWVAVFFHLSIELSAAVEVFSLAAIAALVIWATPATRDRVVLTGDDRWIRRLDWLARFRIDHRPGSPLAVVDRDGERLTGDVARWFVASRLPLTAMVGIPGLALARRRASDR